jgi:drug/metabolite transporter (DMT)-like permease
MSYGVADFLGGVASRHRPALAIALLSQLVGLAVLLAASPLFLRDPVTVPALGWGAAGGMVGAVGLVALYRGLARGHMAVVAPVAALVGAVVPIGFGLLIGDPVGPVALTGVVVALTAVGLVSWTPQTRRALEGPAPVGRLLPGFRDAILAGTAFGAFFILFARAGDAPGAWPMLGVRGASVTLLSVIALARRVPLRGGGRVLPAILAIGTMDMGANLLYLMGTRTGLLTIVVVLTSLYPATTVLLARAVLRERLRRLQVVGLAAAAVGVVLIALG